MALGNVLLSGLSSVASKAYDAYKNKSKATTQTANTAQTAVKTVTPTTKAVSNTPTVTDHQSYINQNYSGGIDAYKKLQQERYNGAYASNDQGLISRLNQDSQTRGYSLSTPQTQQVAVNPYEDAAMAELQNKYNNLNSQYENANKVAVAQGVNRLNSQKATINQGFDDNARQAYIASMQSKNALPQQLASQGINGGATESAMLGLSTNYQNNLNSINTNRQNSLLDIDNAVLDLKNSGDLSTAEQVLANNQAALSAYQSMLNNSASYNQWLSEYNANRSDTKYNQNYQEGRDQVADTNYNNELASANKQTEYNNILNRLGMGLISSSDAVSLGVPAADVQAYVNRIKAAQNAELANTVASTNKINTNSTSKAQNTAQSNTNPLLTTVDKYLAQGNREKAITALASIYTNEQIKQYLENKGYRIDDIDWGTEDTETSNLYENPLLSMGNIVSYYKNKGYTNEQIAKLLND